MLLRSKCTLKMKIQFQLWFIFFVLKVVDENNGNSVYKTRPLKKINNKMAFWQPFKKIS